MRIASLASHPPAPPPTQISGAKGPSPKGVPGVRPQGARVGPILPTGLRPHDSSMPGAPLRTRGAGPAVKGAQNPAPTRDPRTRGAGPPPCARWATSPDDQCPAAGRAGDSSVWVRGNLPGQLAVPPTTQPRQESLGAWGPRPGISGFRASAPQARPEEREAARREAGGGVGRQKAVKL